MEQPTSLLPVLYEQIDSAQWVYYAPTAELVILLSPRPTRQSVPRDTQDIVNSHVVVTTWIPQVCESLLCISVDRYWTQVTCDALRVLTNNTFNATAPLYTISNQQPVLYFIYFFVSHNTVVVVLRSRETYIRLCQREAHVRIISRQIRDKDDDTSNAS